MDACCLTPTFEVDVGHPALDGRPAPDAERRGKRAHEAAIGPAEPVQPPLFRELTERATTRDHVNDDAAPGRGCWVLDAMTAATTNSTAQTCEAG